jgi:hypothetical protein
MKVQAATTRFIAIITNVLFLGVGMFLLITGSVIASSGGQSGSTEVGGGANILSFFPTSAIGAVFIILGLFLLLITAAGILGVLRKSERLLCIYLPTVFMLVMAQAVMVLIFLSLSSNLGLLVDTTMQETWMSPSNFKTNEQFQESFGCCGYSSPDDSLEGLACPSNWDGSSCKEAAVAWMGANAQPMFIAVAIIVLLELIAWGSVCYVRGAVKETTFEDTWGH